MKKKLIALVLAGVFTLMSTAGSAFAVIKYPPEGGTWNYGREGPRVWSYYINSTPKHATSTDGASGLRRSSCAGVNQWARISDSAKNGGNRAFYRNTCP